MLKKNNGFGGTPHLIVGSMGQQLVPVLLVALGRSVDLTKMLSAENRELKETVRRLGLEGSINQARVSYQETRFISAHSKLPHTD